jgi:hypothetical protein
MVMDMMHVVEREHDPQSVAETRERWQGRWVTEAAGPWHTRVMRTRAFAAALAAVAATGFGLAAQAQKPAPAAATRVVVYKSPT